MTTPLPDTADGMCLERPLAPLREEIEEYRITREESCLTAGAPSESHKSPTPGSPDPRSIEGGLRVIRTTTATHTQNILLPPQPSYI